MLKDKKVHNRLILANWVGGFTSFAPTLARDVAGDVAGDVAPDVTGDLAWDGEACTTMLTICHLHIVAATAPKSLSK